MKHLFALLLLLPVLTKAQLNGSALLSGRVVGESHEGLASVSITVKGASTGP
jgi:hypothetical protein